MVAQIVVITSVRQIMPSERQERLIYLGQVFSDACWEIGQLAVLTIDDLHRATKSTSETGQVVEIGVMEVYKEFANLTGKATRTIREYVQVVDFYRDNDIESMDVFPGLSFDHFRTAMRNPDLWREMLSACILEAHNRGGVPPSVDWMEARFGNVNTTEGELEAFGSESRALEGLRGIAEESDPDKKLKIVVSHLMGLVQSVQKTMALLPFELSRVEKLLGDLMDELERLEKGIHS